jgi:MraZ protein
VSFLGEYEHSIDAKQRLAIPAEIRNELDPEIHGDRLVLAPGANGYLWIWPETTFNALARAAMDGSFLSDDEMLEFRQEIFSQSSWLTIDSAKRVRIPEARLAEYGISGTVMVLGVGDHLELVDANAWKALREQRKGRRMEIWRQARKAQLRQGNGGTTDTS